MDKKFVFVFVCVILTGIMIATTATTVAADNVTAKGLDLTFSQMRYDNLFPCVSGFLITAETNVKDRSPIFMEVLEDGNVLGKLSVRPNLLGKIDRTQPFAVKEGCRITVNFYRQGQKVATVSSTPVANGKAIFGPVLLTTETPSKWGIEILNQAYDVKNNRLSLGGETNIPLDGKIVIRIQRIAEYGNYRIAVSSGFTTPNVHTGFIKCDRYVSVVKGKYSAVGRYLVTVTYGDREYVMGMGLQNGKVTDWCKNVFVPIAVIA